ncbi:MAG TPA: hypothetical protein VF614_14430 [Chthoniobacteraceae bacterium]|jgi:hypothetical protein
MGEDQRPVRSNIDVSTSKATGRSAIVLLLLLVIAIEKRLAAFNPARIEDECE